MREAQKRTLQAHAPTWHDRIDALPDGPILVVANEFLDALPIRQFVYSPKGWRERRVGVSKDSTQFNFVLDAEEATIELPETAPTAAICEVSHPAQEVAAWFAERVARQSGAALFIDYGPARSGFGDTLQSLRAHRRHDPLVDPGTADITAHVDFAALASVAERVGARAFGPEDQGEFLTRLGIVERLKRLKVTASSLQASALESGYRRLVDPEAMGGLYKALAIGDPALPPLAGFAP
jgi:NADH dehydrogenase [ubiquinone] 1 alpha subcomplex assembly factor 7